MARSKNEDTHLEEYQKDFQIMHYFSWLILTYAFLCISILLKPGFSPTFHFSINK